MNLQHLSSWILQESPPAWTQEAYRPPCSEYSFCCPNWVPPPAGPGRYPPRRVPPQLDLAGTPPRWTWQVPPPPQLDLAGYPPQLDLAGTPPPVWTWQVPPPSGPGRVPPPLGVDWQTKWNYYLPVVLRTRTVNITVTTTKSSNEDHWDSVYLSCFCTRSSVPADAFQ